MMSRILTKLRGKFPNLDSRSYCITSRRCSFQMLQVKAKRRPHTPVMANEVLKYLNLSSGETIVDMTFGAGGHSRKILESVPDVRIFALDRDPVAHEFAQELALEYPGQVFPLLGRFSELPKLLEERQVAGNSIDGFLFDFGCSSMQFDVGERGFSVVKNGPLDMRMDGFRCLDQPTAADVIARASEEDLARIIKVYGEEKQAKQIARALVEARYTFKKLETTQELADLVESVLEDDTRTDMLGRSQHTATKTFQAFRIFVNNELNEINYAMFVAQAYLKIGGRLITISFHSLEDTIVKRHLSGNLIVHQSNKLPLEYCNYLKSFSENEIVENNRSPWHMLHPHVLSPEPDEIESNPRSRSARFRAIVKINNARA